MVKKDFQNGKIYQILNTVDTEIYVGSTCQPLSKRMATHRGSANSSEKKDKLLYTHVKNIGIDKFYIELIEEYPCENIEQLRKREGHYIRELGTLNHVIAGRSKKEWESDNKEHLKENKRIYYNENKEKIHETMKQYHQTHAEEIKEYHHKHYQKKKEEYSQKQKEYYVQNKETIKEAQKKNREEHVEEIKEQKLKSYQENKEK